VSFPATQKGASVSAWMSDLSAALNQFRPAEDRLKGKIGLADYVAKTAGFPLDPWQEIMCRILTRLLYEEGVRLLIHGPPQFGKPCWVESLVLMADGTRKRLADVVVGDQVVTHAGKAGLVTAVHGQGYLPCVRLSTHGGRETVAALDHPFLTPEGFVAAGELRLGQALASVIPDDRAPSARLDEEFRLAGYFIGDGACGEYGGILQSNITCADP
jgi:hypothetical protein